MRLSSANLTSSRIETRTSERARVGLVLLVLVCFLIVLGAGAYWYRQAGGAHATDPTASGRQLPALPEVLTSALQRLDSPVEIRFYVPSTQATLPEPPKAFVGRVDQLLAWYEHEAGGKIHLTRLDPLLNPDAARSAKMDGISPSPLTTGDVYYLGLTLVYHDQKETLPPLAPEWELALESDLSRTILRLTTPKSVAQRTANSATPDPAVAQAIMQDIIRVIPNPDSISAAEGSKILREAALEQFNAAASEMQSKLDAAQQKLAAAQLGKSEPDQQAALKQLRQIQAEQTEKLKKLARRMQDQIAAWDQLKGIRR